MPLRRGSWPRAYRDVFTACRSSEYQDQSRKPCSLIAALQCFQAQFSTEERPRDWQLLLRHAVNPSMGARGPHPCGPRPLKQLPIPRPEKYRLARCISERPPNPRPNIHNLLRTNRMLHRINRVLRIKPKVLQRSHAFAPKRFRHNRIQTAMTNHNGNSVLDWIDLDAARGSKIRRQRHDASQGFGIG